MIMAASSDDINTQNEKGGIFECGMCGLREAYHYYGRQPPFHRAVTFMEECYLAKDPFHSGGGGSFLLLGSECVSCSQVVCQANSCSVFYAHRFCLKCAAANIMEFPSEMQQRINKNLK